jgi:hypothetical protein
MIIFPLFFVPSISSYAARISVHGNNLSTYISKSPRPAAPVRLPTTWRVKRSTKSA